MPLKTTSGLRQARLRVPEAAVLGGAACLLAAAGAIGYFGLGAVVPPGRPGPPGSVDRPVQEVDVASPPDISTALWFGTERRREGSPQEVSWLILLALNHASDRAAVVYLPAHTAVEIPGRGLHAVGDDIELGPHRLAVWETMLGRFDALPHREQLATLDPVLSEEVATGQARLLRGVAAVGSKGLTVASIPVSQLGAGGDELYSLQSDASRELLEHALGVPVLSGAAVQVQVLNGNGVPGVGEEVAERLVGEGYKIALSGNASRLDHRRTLIVAYDRSTEGQRSAERVRRLLGTGEVQVAAQPQGIVDLTIVVGKDFSQR